MWIKEVILGETLPVCWEITARRCIFCTCCINEAKRCKSKYLVARAAVVVGRLGPGTAPFWGHRGSVVAAVSPSCGSLGAFHTEVKRGRLWEPELPPEGTAQTHGGLSASPSCSPQHDIPEPEGSERDDSPREGRAWLRASIRLLQLLPTPIPPPRCVRQQPRAVTFLRGLIFFRAIGLQLLRLLDTVVVA